MPPITSEIVGGGAIFITAANLGLGAADSTVLFTHNDAGMGIGGALYFLIPEGMISSSFDLPFVYNSLLRNNAASAGGAIAVVGAGSNQGGLLVESCCFFSNNDSGSKGLFPGWGGALMSYNTTEHFSQQFSRAMRRYPLLRWTRGSISGHFKFNIRW